MNIEEKQQQVKNDLVGRFTWRIENFSSLDQSKLCSISFAINENKWRLLLYLDENIFETVKFLSVYLDVPDSANLPSGWSRTAKCSLHLINHIDTKKTVKRERKCRFDATDSFWGFTSFYRPSEFDDKNGDYLVNDTCLIEVEITELDGLQDKPLDNSAPDDPMESVYIKAESFLKSIPKKSSSPISDAICEVEVPLFKDHHAILVKESLNKLISIPLKDMVNPKHEATMIDTWSVLSDYLSLFSNEQTKEIMNLKATFSTIPQTLRVFVKFKVSNQHLSSTLEGTGNLLEYLVKNEEGAKAELEELNEREKELERKLDLLQSKKRRLEEERIEASKQIKQVYALAEEQSLKIKHKKAKLNLANKELEDMEYKWASLKALFT